MIKRIGKYIIAAMLMMTSVAVRGQEVSEPDTLGVACEDTLLTGTVMGVLPAVDYKTGDSTRTKNLPENAFDGKLNTFYASYKYSGSWVGMDLGRQCVVTKIGWCARNTQSGKERVELGVFEGANREDFLDAVPLYMIPQMDTVAQMRYVDVACSKGFRYVRYVSPANGRCTIAEIEFWGHEGEGEDTLFYHPTNLPCVVIHTVNNELPQDKENYIRSMVTVISDQESKVERARRNSAESQTAVGQTVIMRDSAGIRLRGNASMTFPKKPYRIKFDHKQRVLGGKAKAKDWVLVNNYGDKTLMRNIVAFHVSEIFAMPYTPYSQPVDVFVNGEYKGNYQLCDKVEVKKERIEIEEMSPLDTVGEALTGGYMWEIDGNAKKEPHPYYTPHNMPITLHSPKDEDIQPAQREYFENYFNLIDHFVYLASASDTTWRRLVDFSTFVRYFLINQICANGDAYWQCFMYKKRGDTKAYTGPVWDFDLAFDNDKRRYPIAETTEFIYSAAANTSPFVRHIIHADSLTEAEMVGYWHKARHAGLDEDRLIAFVDSVAEELDASQQLNFRRWKILDKEVHQNPVALGSYSAEVERLKEFIGMRLVWTDNKLGYTWEPDVPEEPEVISATENMRIDVKGYRVYDLFGRLIYAGEKMPELKGGIYIIQHNNQTTKILR